MDLLRLSLYTANVQFLSFVPGFYAAMLLSFCVLAFRAAMNAHSESPVWVHCAANKRVSVFVALYGQLELGWSTDQAKNLIEEVWEPTDPWISLSEDILAREREAI